MSVIPTIRPISELKNTTGISNLCHEVKAPVFITKNGYSDLVIMSIDTYERNMALSEIYSKLGEAEEQLASGMPTKSHKEVISNLRGRVNAKL
jgi:PHD/YefM family antitoxin component YafN of YafNO toxin-antitoxin module